ncbi:MAG: hypothetical protein M1833_007280 [Piccolia ochrophora]|nr:MAG: hypothetical protein M1833_007280 [Piccolia ochrophora]
MEQPILIICSSIPVELIGSSSDDQTEIFLLFEEHIDFDQVGSVGWTLLESTAFNDTMGGQGSSSSTWLIGRYRQQMTESIDESAIFEAMCMSLCDFDQTLLRMLVDLSEDAINYRDRHDTRSYGVLGEVIENLLWIRDYDNLADKFGLLCERGANLHLICAGETPTSRALGFSFVFRKWMDLLHRAGWGFEEIVKGELTSTEYPLYKRGWRVATLKDLFDFCSRFYWEGVSTSCHTDGQFSVSGILAEPWWEELLQKFRARECVCSFLEKCELSGLLKPSSPVHDFEESEKPLHDHIDDHSYNHGELPREDDVTSNEGHVMWSDTRANSEPLDVSVGNGQPSSDVSMNIHICDWRSPEWRDRYISGSQTWEDYSKATSKDDSEEATNEGSQGDLEENSEENSVEMRDEGDALPEDPCVDECAVHRFYRWSWDIPEDYNRETVMHDFFARGGTWRRWYAPGHLYHWKCLAMLEAREDELRAPIDEDESATASMPGAFIP